MSTPTIESLCEDYTIKQLETLIKRAKVARKKLLSNPKLQKRMTVWRKELARLTEFEENCRNMDRSKYYEQGGQ